MKRTAAILLILILLFNWYGYQLFYNYIQQQSNLRLESLLDKDQYSREDLLMVKIPLNLPYMNDQSEFQRVDGEISLNGIQYKYVKRKVSQDTLYLMCLPDKEKMKLTQARNEYFKSVTDIQQNGKSKEGHQTIKIPFTEVYVHINNWYIQNIHSLSGLFYPTIKSIHSSPTIDDPAKPPIALLLLS